MTGINSFIALLGDLPAFAENTSATDLRIHIEYMPDLLHISSEINDIDCNAITLMLHPETGDLVFRLYIKRSPKVLNRSQSFAVLDHYRASLFVFAMRLGEILQCGSLHLHQQLVTDLVGAVERYNGGFNRASIRDISLLWTFDGTRCVANYLTPADVDELARLNRDEMQHRVPFFVMAALMGQIINGQDEYYLTAARQIVDVLRPQVPRLM